jgi:diguanylate cyclase (GGDEF)-like protein
MGFLVDFLRQKAPKSGKDMPVYYRKALSITAVLLIAYFLASTLLFILVCGRFEFVPLVAALLTGATLWKIKRLGPRIAGLTESTLVGCWCLWFVHCFGWGAGAQQLLVTSLILAFFNVSEKPVAKVVFCLSIVAVRIAFYVYSTSHAELYPLSGQARLIFQVFNSLFIYALLGCQCMLFSTNTQDTERQLRLSNEELHKEAGTDPLTQLPNRRAMTNAINSHLSRHSGEPFSVAIADIDFFKSVNDTYGHNCGDYTLRTLSAKFREMAEDRYRVCRWGGEEFCFFMPGLNLDEAGALMHDVCTAVKMMPLSFEGAEFSITITIGVAENDFRSSLQAILEEADRKLYMGKNSGRDQVVL